MTDKYPRTPHFPFSPGIHDDDVILGNYTNLLGQNDIIITEKLDGGNCCLKDGMIFARTHSAPATHASFSMVKQLYNASLVYQFPSTEQPDIVPDALLQDFPLCFGNGLDVMEHLELFGENMMAIHSINYTPEDSATKKPHNQLPGPFYLFGVFDRRTESFWEWDAVVAFATLVGLPTPPVLFRGRFATEEELQQFILDQMRSESEIGPRPPSSSTSSAVAAASLENAAVPSTVPSVPKEGVVVRSACGFARGAFSDNVAKFVRKGHIQTDENFKTHWKQASIAM